MAANENDWFKKYVDQVMSELNRLEKSIAGCNTCVKLKMNKLKPATIVSMLAGLVMLIGLTAGGIYASYSKGVTERKENMEYMIIAEAGKAREKLNDYCKKEKVYEMDTKLNVLEEKTNNISKTVNKLDKRSEKIYEIMQDLERRSRDSD